MEKYGIFKVKKEFNRNCLERYLMADILDKDLNNCLKDPQRTRGKCGESKEKDTRTKWKYQ